MRPTPKYRHAPVKMHMVEPNEDALPHLGDFYWRMKAGKRIFVVAIPIDKNLHPLWSQWTIDHKNHCGAQWNWDGNETEPTLKPSLHANGIWHGFVRKGMLVEA